MKLNRKNQNKNLSNVRMYDAESDAYNNYNASQQLGSGGAGKPLPEGFHYPDLKEIVTTAAEVVVRTPGIGLADFIAVQILKNQ